MEQKGEAMTTARELLQEARDYLASSDEVNARCLAEDIHAFLAQPEPELVAWLKGTRICISIESDESMLQDGWTPLYAAQPEPAAPAPTLLERAFDQMTAAPAPSQSDTADSIMGYRLSMRFTARARLGTWAHASRVQSDEVTYDIERAAVGSVVAGVTADRCGKCGACDRSVVPVAMGNR